MPPLLTKKIEIFIIRKYQGQNCESAQHETIRQASFPLNTIRTAAVFSTAEFTEVFITPLLIVIDMQNDFISQALGTAEARSIVPAVREKIKNFPGNVIYTRDTHQTDYLHTAEGKKLPVPHCIKNSEGWQLDPQIASLVRPEDLLIDKPSFGSMELAEKVKELHEQKELSSITLVGLCTDICVISNAMILKAALPEVPLLVDAACCAGVSPESHHIALQAMSACQITIENARKGGDTL